MVKCERSDLALEPMEPVPKVKWYQPKKKVAVPFTCEGSL